MTRTQTPWVEEAHPRAGDGKFAKKHKPQSGRPSLDRDSDSDSGFEAWRSCPIAGMRDLTPRQLGYPGAASMTAVGAPKTSIPHLAPSYALRKWRFVAQNPQDFDNIEAALLRGIHEMHRRENWQYAGTGSPYAPGQVDVQEDWLVSAYATGMTSEAATYPRNQETIWERAGAEAAKRAADSPFRSNPALSLEDRLLGSAAAAYSAYHGADVTDPVVAHGLNRMLSLVREGLEKTLDRLEAETSVAWQGAPGALEHSRRIPERHGAGLEAHPAAEDMRRAFWDGINDGSFAGAIAEQACQPGETRERGRVHANFWENTKCRGEDAQMFWHSHRPHTTQCADQLALLLIEGTPAPNRLRYGSDQLHAIRDLIDEAPALGKGDTIEVALAEAPDGGGYLCYYRDDLPLGRRAAAALGLRPAA